MRRAKALDEEQRERRISTIMNSELYTSGKEFTAKEVGELIDASPGTARNLLNWMDMPKRHTTACTMYVKKPEFWLRKKWI